VITVCQDDNSSAAGRNSDFGTAHHSFVVQEPDSPGGSDHQNDSHLNDSHRNDSHRHAPLKVQPIRRLNRSRHQLDVITLCKG
jgi:hypothetical protein